MVTVGDIKKRLDDFGDHLPIQIVISSKDDEKTFDDFIIDAANSLSPGVDFIVEV